MQDKQTWQSGAQRLFALPPAFSPSPLHFLQAEKKKKKGGKETGEFWKEQIRLCGLGFPSPNKNKHSGLEGICRQRSAKNIVKNYGGFIGNRWRFQL